MTNPFQVRWLQGWTFEVVLMEGQVQVEARGFGICLRTPLYPGESPQMAADRLVTAEDGRRRALHQAWVRNRLKDTRTPWKSEWSDPTAPASNSLVVVSPQPLAA